MPWRKGDYPPSMKNLPLTVRNKAVEIANALLTEEHGRGYSYCHWCEKCKGMG